MADVARELYSCLTYNSRCSKLLAFGLAAPAGVIAGMLLFATLNVFLHRLCWCRAGLTQGIAKVDLHATVMGPSGLIGGMVQHGVWHTGSWQSGSEVFRHQGRLTGIAAGVWCMGHTAVP